MSIGKDTGGEVQSHTEAWYEELASQEEIYLEEGEERARALLISENQSSSECVTDGNNNSRMAGDVDKQLESSAEELITADSDDPPLSDEAIAEMLGRR